MLSFSIVFRVQNIFWLSQFLVYDLVMALSLNGKSVYHCRRALLPQVIGLTEVATLSDCI